VTLVLGRLLGQDVTFEGLTAFDGTTWTNAEALFSAAFGLHFGHLDAPLICAREAPAQGAQSCKPRDTNLLAFQARQHAALPIYAEATEAASAAGLAAPPVFFLPGAIIMII
jgi:hypothetical protein